MRRRAAIAGRRMESSAGRRRAAGAAPLRIGCRVSCVAVAVADAGAGAGADRGPWTVEQPAQVTACGQAALKGAACGISEPGGRRRKQSSAGVPRACAFQRLAAFTVPMALPAHAQRARRHHCLARDTNDWRRSAHSSYNCRFMSTGSAGCARADSAPHRSTRVRSSPLVARLASCGSKRMRAMRRARARIRERAAACAAIGDRRRALRRRATRYENESSRRIVSRSGRMKRFDSDA